MTTKKRTPPTLSALLAALNGGKAMERAECLKILWDVIRKHHNDPMTPTHQSFIDAYEKIKARPI